MILPRVANLSGEQPVLAASGQSIAELATASGLFDRATETMRGEFSTVGPQLVAKTAANILHHSLFNTGGHK